MKNGWKSWTKFIEVDQKRGIKPRSERTETVQRDTRKKNSDEHPALTGTLFQLQL
jgi:hypothetical protein